MLVYTLRSKPTIVNPHNSNSKPVITYYAKIYSKQYINLCTLNTTKVGVKVPADNLPKL